MLELIEVLRTYSALVSEVRSQKFCDAWIKVWNSASQCDSRLPFSSASNRTLVFKHEREESQR